MRLCIRSLHVMRRCQRGAKDSAIARPFNKENRTMTRPNAATMALRDPALAAALGVIAGMGADFGHATEAEPNVGNDFGGEFMGDFGALDYWGDDAPAAMK